MSYSIVRHSEQLIWVTVQGHMHLDHAEQYYNEMWGMLSASPAPTDLLIDGRRLPGADQRVRRRTEQIVHHPHLGHIAFVVAEHHLLLFGPLVHLVSGIGLFGDDQAALNYLHSTRGQPTRIDPAMIDAPAAPPRDAAQHTTDAANRTLHGLTDLMNSWSRNLRDWGK